MSGKSDRLKEPIDEFESDIDWLLSKRETKIIIVEKQDNKETQENNVSGDSFGLFLLIGSLVTLVLTTIFNTGFFLLIWLLIGLIRAFRMKGF